MADIGFTHIALPVTDVDRSIEFYATFAGMQVVHRRTSDETGRTVVWLCDLTRPFVLVLIQAEPLNAQLLPPFGHLGVGCPSRAVVDARCEQAAAASILLEGPHDAGYPIGYWAYIRDPDGYTLELSYGQKVGLTVNQAAPSPNL